MLSRLFARYAVLLTADTLTPAETVELLKIERLLLIEGKCYHAR